MVKINKEQIVLASIIGAIIITAGVLTGVILTQTEARLGYTLLDRMDYTYDSETVDSITIIDLMINNDEGNIFISYEEDLENIFEAENRFYGKKDAIVQDASEFIGSDDGTIASISFDAPAIFDTSDSRSFYNNLHIKIRADILVKYTISTTLGDVYLVFDSVLTQTVISKLDVFSSLGDISIQFGDNTAVESSTLNTHILNGSLDINFDNVELLSRIDLWNITSDKGTIDIHMDQSDIENNFNATFNIATNSGKADMRYKFPESLGIQISAITSTGDISSDLEIPGPFTPYQNDVFPAEDNYVFSFTAGTGSIKIKELVF